jgi:hypothetical protein
MGKSYYEYEVKDTKSDKIINTIFIPEGTDDKGWVLGKWYLDKETQTPKTHIHSDDGDFIASFVERHYDTEGGDLF